MTLFIIAIVLFVLFTGLVKIRTTDNGKHTDIQLILDDVKAKAMAKQVKGAVSSKVKFTSQEQAS